jgi:hypothetical protein
MKGLMIGMTYCSFFLSGALWLAVSLPFIHIHSIWGTGTLSCGFWYILLFTIVDMGIFLILVLLNEQRYYTTITQSEISYMFCVYTPLMTLFYRLVDVSLKFYQNQYSN